MPSCSQNILKEVETVTARGNHHQCHCINKGNEQPVLSLNTELRGVGSNYEKLLSGKEPPPARLLAAGTISTFSVAIRLIVNYGLLISDCDAQVCIRLF
jgi:hypothetical protein